MRLVLASKSPRRRELIAHLGFPVRFVDADVEERISAEIGSDRVALTLAHQKSEGCNIVLEPDEVLVTADTVVVHNGIVLGKPHTRVEAVEMLRSLSGDSHSVYTGVCLRNSRQTYAFSEHSLVVFRHLDDSIIEQYVEQGTCMDKAGAYGIQEWIGMVGVESIEGCYYNVMGLPLSRLYFELRQLMQRS